MILRNVTIELSGIKRIVIDQTKLYVRNNDNTWTSPTGKIIEDHIMMINVKQMARETTTVIIDKTNYSYDKGKFYTKAVEEFPDKYRFWSHLETLNIDRNIV